MAGRHRADPKLPPVWPWLVLVWAAVALFTVAVSILSSYL